MIFTPLPHLEYHDVARPNTCNGGLFSDHRAAFKIVAAKSAFMIVAWFLHHGNSKVCMQVHFHFI